MTGAITHLYVCFDPRDPSQSPGNQSSWTLTTNAVLISATMHFLAHEEDCQILWDKVAALADLCDDLSADQELPCCPPQTQSFEDTVVMLRSLLRKGLAKHGP